MTQFIYEIREILSIQTQNWYEIEGSCMCLPMKTTIYFTEQLFPLFLKNERMFFTGDRVLNQL